MRAAFFEKHGGVENLRVGDLPDPAPGPADAVVRVSACALNHLDLWVLGGLPGMPVPLPHVGGNDVFGTVESAPPGAPAKAGETVIVCPGLSCGGCRECKRGRESLCASYEILGFQAQGGLAERVAVPARNLIPVGGELSPEEWAAVPLTFLTAWHMLSTRGGIRPGDVVLVQAAGSGVGAAAIPIARFAGARVFATSRSAEKRRRALAAGAEAAFDTSEPNWPKLVKEASGGRGADIVVEHVGGAVFEKSLQCLAPGGRVVTCGATIGFEVKLDLRFFFYKELSVHGALMGSQKELADAVSLVRAGSLKPVVDKVFPLAETRAAYERLQSGEQYGKVVVRVA